MGQLLDQFLARQGSFGDAINTGMADASQSRWANANPANVDFQAQQMQQMQEQQMQQQQQQQNAQTMGRPPEEADFWGKLKMSLMGGDTPEAQARNQKFLGGLETMMNGFDQFGEVQEQPFTSPYKGAGTTLGANYGEGLEALMTQIIGGTR